MAPVKLLPQLRPSDQALAEMQFWWGWTKKTKRGPRGGKQQRFIGEKVNNDHRKAFLRARAGDD